MERIGKKIRIEGGVRIGVKRKGGKESDENDIEIGIDLSRKERKLDEINLRNEDISKKKRKWLIMEKLIGDGKIVKVCKVIKGILKRF